MASIHRSTLLMATALLAAACTTKKADVPEVSGPSELSTSISITATPDTLPQDGHSQSVLVIQARDANAQPVRNLPLRVEIAVNGTVTDFGTLSSKNVSTGSDGRATVTYTAPVSVDSLDRQTLVSIYVTPTSGDAAGDTTRSISVRLVPPGTVGGVADVPDFTFNPSSPKLLESVVFDASDPNLDGVVTNYAWDFGDGATGSGRNPSHQFRKAGTLTVTLTVTNVAGSKGSRSKTITVTSEDPTADFVFSPSDPGVGETIVFNGSTSTAPSPRQIVSYQWQFGTGASASGMIVSKSYGTPGTYNVTLTVTDDAGSKATTTQAVTVGTESPGGLSAKFTFSPTDPTVGQTVNFNASTSTSATTIVEYKWDFGDGATATATSATRGHAYAAAGTYVVTLRITDSQGRTATTTQEVTIS
jgi:PKD repeat protein